MLNERDRLLILLGAALGSAAFKTKVLAALPVEDIPVDAKDLWAAIHAGNKQRLAKLLGVVESDAKLIDAVLDEAKGDADKRFCERQTFLLSHTTGQEYLDTLDAIRSRVQAKVSAKEAQ